MMLFKACPRCGGDMHATSDIYGRYAECIQCGHSRDLPEQRFGVARVVAQDEKSAAAA